MDESLRGFESYLRGLPSPELRKDPIVGRWVIIATDRARRPVAAREERLAPEAPICPFCEGHENQTPPEIVACRDRSSRPNQPGWRVRVVPNKFPALRTEGGPHERCEGLYATMDGVGAHEVIIESPRHEASLTDLSEDTIEEVLSVYRDRLIERKKDQRLVHGTVFKNVGAAAGASLEHVHSQLIVTPIVPATVSEEMSGGRAFYRDRGRCIFCDILGQELGSGDRLVFDAPGFVCLTPFASRFPFETWILPKAHASHFENIENNQLKELGSFLKTVLLKLEGALDRPAYNYIIHTAPFGAGTLPCYHWHIEIIPRLTRVAGFEWGTGFYINPVPPEQAAEFLRTTEAGGKVRKRA